MGFRGTLDCKLGKSPTCVELGLGSQSIFIDVLHLSLGIGVLYIVEQSARAVNLNLILRLWKDCSLSLWWRVRGRFRIVH